MFVNVVENLLLWILVGFRNLLDWLIEPRPLMHKRLSGQKLQCCENSFICVGYELEEEKSKKELKLWLSTKALTKLASSLVLVQRLSWVKLFFSKNEYFDIHSVTIFWSHWLRRLSSETTQSVEKSRVCRRLRFRQRTNRNRHAVVEKAQLEISEPTKACRRKWMLSMLAVSCFVDFELVENSKSSSFFFLKRVRYWRLWN